MSSAVGWPPSAPVERRLDVLIVDDLDSLIRALARSLRVHHDVRGSGSARAALTDIAAREPDVIVCDLMMPELSGMDLHAHLLGSNPALAARMVFHTGGVLSEAMRAFVRAERHRVLYKPASMAELLAAIARAAAGRPPVSDSRRA